MMLQIVCTASVLRFILSWYSRKTCWCCYILVNYSNQRGAVLQTACRWRDYFSKRNVERDAKQNHTEDFTGTWQCEVETGIQRQRQRRRYVEQLFSTYDNFPNSIYVMCAPIRCSNDTFPTVSYIDYGALFQNKTTVFHKNVNVGSYILLSCMWFLFRYHVVE